MMRDCCPMRKPLDLIGVCVIAVIVSWLLIFIVPNPLLFVFGFDFAGFECFADIKSVKNH